MMSTRYSFDNVFGDYTKERADIYFNRNGVSSKFKKILQEFKAKKLNVLLTEMDREIFCNGTVYTGSAGLSLYYLTWYTNSNQHKADNLKLALKYLDLRNIRGRRISFLCGDAGPLAIATIISYKLEANRPDSLPDYKTLSQRLLDLIPLLKESPDELLYGGAGYLYALLFVNRNIPGNVIPPKYIEKVINHILKSGKSFSAHEGSDSPLLWQWHDKVYLGGAHGVAGILYILLQAQSYIDQQDMQSLVKPTLDWLANKQFESGNFPSSLGSSFRDRLVQWCHGAPGFVHLFVLAHQIFGEDKYLEIALKCGEVIWQRGLCSKGYSICHGVSGNAYSFLCLYQATQDPMHYYRACCFVEWCVSDETGEKHTPDNPASLFEGLLGRLFLVEDIFHPEEAKFPAFTL